MNKKEKDLRILLVVMLALFIVSIVAGVYFESKYLEMKEVATLLCNLNNQELEVINYLFPYFEDAMKEDLDPFNLSMPEITWPDPFDCEELIK